MLPVLLFPTPPPGRRDSGGRGSWFRI
jgi:hypothetical protein